MTKKQKRFVEEYLIDLNATQAAIRAGYSPKTANEQGARLLANVSISHAVAKAEAERSKRTGINADRVVKELARIAFNYLRLYSIRYVLFQRQYDVAYILGVKLKPFTTKSLIRKSLMECGLYRLCY